LGARAGWPHLSDDGLPRRGQSFFLDALSIDPSRRPPSANEFYTALRDALLGGP
jgi:hypothetical protein